MTAYPVEKPFAPVLSEMFHVVTPSPLKRSSLGAKKAWRSRKRMIEARALAELEALSDLSAAASLGEAA